MVSASRPPWLVAFPTLLAVLPAGAEDRGAHRRGARFKLAGASGRCESARFS